MIRRVPRGAPEAALALPLAAAAPRFALQQALEEARREQALLARLRPQLARALAALLDEELALRPEHIRAVVDRELARVRRAREIELRVHPDDATLLDAEAALQERLALLGALRVVPDAALARGGCVIATVLGEVDARLETRLALAVAQLEDGGFDAR